MEGVNSTQYPPGFENQVNDYVTVLMTIIHSEGSREEVLEVLKGSQDPYITVPKAALTVNDMARQQFQQGGASVSEDVMLASSQYLVGDLIELGIAIGQFQADENDKVELYQDTLEAYVERGLTDGSTDPIELQLAAEKFMSTNQKIGGQYLAQQNGLGYEPSQQQMMQQHGAMVERKTKTAAADKASRERLQQSRASALEGGQNG